MAWFRRDKPKIEDATDDEERNVKTEGIFVNRIIQSKNLEKRIEQRTVRKRA